MGKKNCCKKKKSLSTDCESSSSTSSSSSCTISSYKSCCPKYPKCYCIKDKCAPIYYPNNCVGQYPCNPCKPSCPPYPCPPYPCPTTQCGTKYTANTSIITSNTTLGVNSQNVYICNPTSSNINITLPAISSLGSCSFTKMFLISNISATYDVNIITSGDSLTNPSAATLSQGDSISLYAVNVSGGAYWVVA